jgi:Zn-dependent protease
MQSPQLPLSKTVRKMLDMAAGQAGQRQAQRITPEHLLLALLELKGNTALEILTDLQVKPHELRRALEAGMPPPVESSWTMPPLGEDAGQVLRDGVREAAHLGHAEVGAAHVLMGLLYERKGAAYDILTDAGVSVYEIRQYILSHPKKFKKGSIAATQVRAEGFPLPSPLFLVLVAVMVATGLGLYLSSGNSALVQPLTILFVTSGWVVSLCIHEFGHALAAYQGGDYSVREMGYLTLNPLKYTHPLLSIVLPLLIMFLGGIGLPGGAVYTNPYALRNQWWRSLVSAAGPLGTIAFCALIAWPFVFGLGLGSLWQPVPFWSALAFLALLQVTALLFNLLPIPPLDGFGIIAPYLPDEIRIQAYRFGNLLFLLVLFIFWQGGALTQAFWDEVFNITRMLGIPPFLISQGMTQFGF